jgi:spore coat polysaccharide biosynthesis protein SpsF
VSGQKHRLNRSTPLARSAQVGAGFSSSLKVVAVVQARMSSARFPGKVLTIFRGAPVLEHVLRAAEAAVGRDAVVIATSVERSDDVIEQFARSRGTAVVRGDLENVLARFQAAARAYPAEWVLRVTADSPLLTGEMLRDLIEAADNGWDLITTTWPRTFPTGCNAELIRSDVLMAIDPARADASEREHVTRYLYNRENQYRIRNLQSGRPELACLNLAIDEPDDLVRLERMTDQELADLLQNPVVR